METVANISGEAGTPKRMPLRKRRLLQHIIRSARRMCRSRMDYYSQPDLLDYAREDADMMETLFTWLGSVSIDTERLQRVGMYYLIHADVSRKEKEEVGKSLTGLVAFTQHLALMKDTIAEKEYYYASITEELDGVLEYRAAAAAAAV